MSNRGFICVHIGAGYHSKNKTTSYTNLCRDACIVATDALRNEFSALEVAELTTAFLEDSALTNAGYGSNLTIGGKIECDASVMESSSFEYGAVGAIRCIKNPIKVACNLLENQKLGYMSLGRIPPNTLVSDGAYNWATNHNISSIVTDKEMMTKMSMISYKKHITSLKQIDSKVVESINVLNHNQKCICQLDASSSFSEPFDPVTSELNPIPVTNETMVKRADSNSPKSQCSNLNEPSHKTRESRRWRGDLKRLSSGSPDHYERVAKKMKNRKSCEDGETDSGTIADVGHVMNSSPRIEPDHSGQISCTHKTRSRSMPTSDPDRLTPKSHGNPSTTIKSSNGPLAKPSHTPSGSQITSTTATSDLHAPTIAPALTIATSSPLSNPANSPNQTRAQVKPDTPSNCDESKLNDTIGVICMDDKGVLVSAVSSGGIILKQSGRLGQAAIYGGGCWAEQISDYTHVASVTSGCGEYLTKTLFAKTVGQAMSNSNDHTSEIKNAYDNFMNSRFTPNNSNNLAGSISVRTDLVDDQINVAVIIAHNTRSMGVGIQFANEDEPKAFISRQENDESKDEIKIHAINVKV